MGSRRGGVCFRKGFRPWDHIWALKRYLLQSRREKEEIKKLFPLGREIRSLRSLVRASE